MPRFTLPQRAGYAPTVELDPDRVLELLAASRWDDLLGLEETDRVECKSVPYRLDEDHQKLELAKDVCGLANASGGIIVLGLGTKREPTRALDVVRTKSPFEIGLFDGTRCQQVITGWIYPPLVVDVHDFTATPSTDRKYTAITVRDPLERPYIVVRTLTEEGRRVELTVGYFERQQSHIPPMTPHRLQQLLRDGMRFDTYLREFSELKGGPGLNRPLSQRSPTARLPERIEEAVTTADPGARPTYILASAPTEPVDLHGLVESDDSPTVRLIESPPEVRAHGFGVRSTGEPRLVRGELRRSAGFRYHCLDVWRDGTVVYVAPGDDDFLCWGPTRDGAKINPLVLAESTFLFVLFVQKLHALNGSKAPLEFRLLIRTAESLTMVPYKLEAVGNMFKGNQHPAPDLSKEIVVTAALEYEPEKVSYELRKELYFWFGFTQDQLPYVAQSDGQPQTDPGSFTSP